MRGTMITVNRPPAIMTKTRVTYETLNKVLDTTIKTCMSRYKYALCDVEYLYWIEFFNEIICDEVDGYVKRQYSRIPSIMPSSFAKFVEREFNTLIAPVFNKIIHRDSNKQKRQRVIMQCNQQFQQCPCDDDNYTQKICKVKFDTTANTIYVFERNED